MSTSKTMRWVSGGFEILLGIPLLGGLIVMGFAYVPLLIALILHITTLVICSQENEPKGGSILGIVTSLIAWIPFVGMIMHIITGIVLMVSAAKSKSVPVQPPHQF